MTLVAGMDEDKQFLRELTTKGLYSTDLRGKPMTVETFYDAISIINNKSEQYQNYANMGFYKVGKLLAKANDELGKGDWGKLRKKIHEGGLHIKTQERYIAIARNPNIELNYANLPEEWTTWLKLAKLKQEDFDKIQHLISKDMKWKDVEPLLIEDKDNSNGELFASNDRPHHKELFGLQFNTEVGTKRHLKEFQEFSKEIKQLAKKYSFIKLDKKNYFDKTEYFLTHDEVEDDTTMAEAEGESKSIFKKQYQSYTKIDI